MNEQGRQAVIDSVMEQQGHYAQADLVKIYRAITMANEGKDPGIPASQDAIQELLNSGELHEKIPTGMALLGIRSKRFYLGDKE